MKTSVAQKVLHSCILPEHVLPDCIVIMSVISHFNELVFDNLPQTIVDELCAQYDLNDFDKALVEMYVSLPAGSRERIKEYMKQLVKKVGWDKTE